MNLVCELILSLSLVANAGPASQAGEVPDLGRTEVYVRENFEARQTLAHLKALESGAAWGEAAEGYDRLAAGSGEELVRVDELHYRNIRDYVLERLLSWPLDARRRYRDLFERRTELDLDSLSETGGGQPETDRLGTALEALAERRWLTRAGGLAAQRAAERLLRAGKVEAAGRWFERLAREHPDYAANPEMSRRAAEMAEQAVRRSDPGATWPMFGGDASRGRTGKAGAEPGELYWALRLPSDPGATWQTGSSGPPQDRSGPQTRRLAAPVTPGDVGSADSTSQPTNTAAPYREDVDILPVADAERVFIQRGVRLWAAGLENGVVQWTYDGSDPESDEPEDFRRVPHPFKDGGAIASSDRETPGLETTPGEGSEAWRGYVSPVVSRGRVFANLTQVNPRASGRVLRSTLVCLEATTGRLIWQVEAFRQDLGGLPHPADFFDGSPLAYEGRLYVVVRRGRELGFEDCWLACFEPATGRQLWRIMIASGLATRDGARLLTRSDPAGSGGDVFVQTNLGAVACVEGRTGRIRWVTLDGEAAGQTTKPGKRRDQPFLLRGRAGAGFKKSAQPVVIGQLGDSADRHVFTVPIASGDLVVYRAENGQESRRIPGSKLGPLTYLLGPAGGMVYTVGERVAAWDVAAGRKQWELDCRTLGGTVLSGRPFLANDRLFVPLRSAIAWVSLDGVTRGRFDLQRLAGPGGQAIQGGNLVAAGELMLMAGAEGVCCLPPTGRGMTRLAARVEQNPGDSTANLDLARLALSRPGELRRGLDALDWAMVCARSGSVARLDAEREVERVRDRALAIVLETVGRLPAKEAAPEDEWLIQELLQRAESWALTEQQQVSYRLAFAEIYEHMKTPEQAVRLYQQILNSAPLRATAIPHMQALVPFTEASTGGIPLWMGHVPAGRLAERGIDYLIHQYGRQVYAHFDAEAAGMLAKGQSARDRELLREIIDRYPAAAVIAAALRAWMPLAGQVGDPLEAARTGQRMLMRRPEIRTQDRAAIIGQVAVSYFEAGDAVQGLAWLTRGQREQPSAKWNEGGEVVTFGSLRRNLLARVEKLGAGGAGAARVRPGTAVSSPSGTDGTGASQPVQGRARLEGNGEMLLTAQEPPRQRSRDLARPALSLTWAAGRLHAFDSVTGKTLWEAFPVHVGTPVWLGCRGNLLVFSTRYQVFALDRRNGGTRWILGEVPRRAMSSAIDPEILTSIRSVAFGETVAAAFLGDGGAVGFDLETGEALWGRTLPHKAGAVTAINDQHVAYISSGEEVVTLVVLDAATGREVCTTPLDSTVYRCDFTPERTLLIVGADRLECFDPYTGQRLWRVDGLKLPLAASLSLEVGGFRLAQESGVALRSYGDGRLIQNLPFDSSSGGR